MRERLNLLRDDLELMQFIAYMLANGYDEQTPLFAYMY